MPILICNFVRSYIFIQPINNICILVNISNVSLFQEKVKQLETQLTEKTEAASRQDKIIQMLKGQVKMMQMLTSDSSPAGRRKIISENVR